MLAAAILRRAYSYFSGATRKTAKGLSWMFNESALTKGQLRKLAALRKSVGPAIADEAFAKWLKQAVVEPGENENAKVISDALWGLIEEGKLSIRRSGYVVRRGRGRVIVEAV